MGILDKLITPHPLYNSLTPEKEVRQLAYKQLFKDRLHVKMIKLLNDSAEKGDVLGAEGFHHHIERLIGRVTTQGHHGGDRKSERFKNQQL